MKIGVDVTQISRIKEAAENTKGFLQRVFTDREIKYFSGNKIRWDSVAGSFAVKEAFSKYLGIGLGKAGLHLIELLHSQSGEPYICYNGKKTNTAVSISHSGDIAVAVVCGADEPIFCHSDYIKALIPKRQDNAHKGECGRVFILAGSEGMTGAAALSAMGALRIGAGLVTVGTAKSQREILAVKLTEAMTKGFAEVDGGIGLSDKEKIREIADASDAFVIGMGMGRNEETKQLIRYLAEKVKTPMIIDADGLNALSGNIDILKRRQGQTVVTPHEGEMARLLGKTPEEVRANREKAAKDFAKETGAVTVLKGKNTLVSHTETFVNPTGNVGMATGGSGDVLAGVIGGLTAQGLPPYDAAVLGAYVHGFAGDIAKHKKGEMGLIASDIAENLPYAVLDIIGE